MNANVKVLTSRAGPYVDIGGGHRVFVRDWGRGAPVVLLSGWGMDSRCWGDTMVGLSDAGLRAIAYDRRGHGRSDDPGEIDYDLLADDLAAVLDALDLRGATLVAHSGAGGEVIRYLTRHGDARVRGIVLVGATGPRMIAEAEGAPGLTQAMADAVTQRLRDDMAGWIEENLRPFAPQASERTLDWLATMVLDASRRLLVDFQRVIVEADMTAEAAALQVPVTIIHGDQDASAPVDLTARRYAALLPHAELLIYEGVAHGVMVTHTARLARDIAARVPR